MSLAVGLITAVFILLLILVGIFWRSQAHSRQVLNSHQKNETSLLFLQQQMETLREQLQRNFEGSSQGIQQQLQGLNQQLNERLKDSNQSLQRSQEAVTGRLDQAARVIGDLKEKLGKLEEANTRMIDVGRDIRSLQEILKTPKLRGSLGEFLLADLLGQILPREHFSLQHSFKNQEKVDAIIRIGEKLVCVDAKFPLENFSRLMAAIEENEKKGFKKTFVSDVKKHIDAIATKYIRPEEETYDFALMYVPAENVYYEVMIKDDLGSGEHALTDYAMKKRVIPVSPNTLYVYLNTIVLGLKGLRVEKTAQEILSGLSRLEGDLGKIQESFRKLGGHLRHADGLYGEVQGRFEKFGDRMHGLQHQVSLDAAAEPFASAEIKLIAEA